MFEDPLPAQATHGVFAARAQGVRFHRAGAFDRHQPIDVARGKSDDSAAAELLADQGRQIDVHGPGASLVSLRAEFYAGHEDHVGNIGKAVDKLPLEQVALNGLDLVRLQGGAALGLRKAAHAQDPPRHARRLGGALRHAGQGGAHLAGHAQDEQVALDSPHRPHGGRRRPAQEFLQRFGVLDFFGQGFQILRVVHVGLQPFSGPKLAQIRSGQSTTGSPRNMRTN